MNTNPESRLVELKLILPPTPKPLGVYKPVLIIGKFLYVSGQGPLCDRWNAHHRPAR